MEDFSIIYLWMCCVLYLNGVLADDLPYQEFEGLTKVDNAMLEHDSNIMMGKLDDVLAGLNKREQETRRLVEEFAQKVSLHQTHQKEESSEVTEKLAGHMMKSETTLGQKVSDRKKRSRGDLGVPDTVAPSLEMNGTCYVEACPQRPFLLVPGRDGQPGAPGQRGSPGDRGSKGDRGSTGLPGTIGPNGDIGPKGVKGTEGDSGQRGSKGAKGMQGRIGVQGTKGDSGISGSGTTSKTHYTRWGSRTCEGTAQLVYEGYAAGAYYDQKGGGANYVCLPRNPTYDRPDAGVNTWRAYMYGAEYEVVNFPPFSGLDNGDVACAVCSVSERSVTFMQPARIDCPDGWTREYYGYLMAQSYIYYRSEWACVDHSATLTSSSSTGNSDGALFYPTEVHCGNSHTGLPCEDYTAGYEVTCAVCTR